MNKISKRGFDESDKHWFSRKELIRLVKAQEEIEWLINRDYKIDPVATFVGDRYQFSIRQRDALKRAVCTDEKNRIRQSKILSLDKINEGIIYIDGFNLIIALEVALSGGTLVIGRDGNIRDLAGLRGTYKIIDKTEEALNLIGKFFNKYKAPKIKFYLDAPVSNSGNLRYKILEHAKEWKIETEVELVKNADVILEKLDRVVSSDAVIVDKCISYFNVARSIIEEYIKDCNIVNLNG
ncbi:MULTISPECIES: DUF434 domain-containing protein [unclassified Clostridioides]|uniref:DUF434 domain-containing protein n=1 Tax=unclassified Clostridioides TaxID=2635829 RepID=UPI001D0FD5EF|nr:DUF434 domain-containing protein [Clostridioides sp. ZZV14-6150]MCC0661595.1 DUF434 domain-containing protein [Clostridioides sp. ZZV14-6154]MCC0668968.1 DUF434 domain-containing protein [Clostridioides sp. ZZV14-6153]MCC0718216.1 DUF434 domain-containing protein [Clostridioides sp. ZZV14-6105]MCC0721557.1 DUF434 domain-containing protein [Clostridioides sp. ZZV14-6104]MCC0743888.1 DUF434 domain-containing protein [Clostridioides sp. ZZV14-6044]MCC0750528.1 DUF434 domain-containing protein